MKIGFRADASIQIGGGHVMRCRTLAGLLTKHGATCELYTSQSDLLFPDIDDAFTVVCDRAIDSRLTKGEFGYFDAFVCDHYRLDADFESRLRAHVGTIAVIDDLASRRHDCDFLLDTTLNRKPDIYKGLVPAHACILTGTNYALLRPAFSELRQKSLAKKRSGLLRRIFVSFGMTDTCDLTITTLQVLKDIASKLRYFVGADILIGSQYARLPELMALTEMDSRFNLHINESNVAIRMSEADLAIGAAGTSSWERCCMGLPTLLAIVAENQNANARALEQASAAVILPLSIFPTLLETTLMELDSSPIEMLNLGSCAATLCDGVGTARIAEKLTEGILRKRSISNAVALRRATLEDSQILLDWRNDSETRANSTFSAPIKRSTHIDWLNQKLSDPATILLIGEQAGIPIGTVRFDPLSDGAREVSIVLAPTARGRGVGRLLLDAACQLLLTEVEETPIIARIRLGNLRSRAIFEKVGFSVERQDDEFLVLYLRGKSVQHGI
ncbi:MAG: UDP-2,4-diacetamido-2,4,6-trideoxy-beta-L-altropyranose hydrolase [Rhizobiales bacterium]|nr:UDP-2,4-diacetamido-2,4,6-trideoxy-beta-L-altropyranose hydrolase [Hyphomicrobiales bacterium]